MIILFVSNMFTFLKTADIANYIYITAYFVNVSVYIDMQMSKEY